MKFYSRVFIILTLFASSSLAQLPNPKYEMRGIWAASLGIDWPSSTGTSTSIITTQKNQLISIFDLHKSYGMNSIFFHVRPACDAVYKSAIEPWSQWLTGTQGSAPADPNYDPLTFACDEAHKRGMELHAWLNPYRALLTSGSVSNLASTHVIKAHPDWIIKCSGTEYRFLDPGKPIVREYLLKVIMDIVRRYDIDGVHFDDYFYPYSSYGAFNDSATYNQFRNGYTDIAAWRTNNVNLLLSMIMDSIKTVKPHVRFGVSPSGNPSVNTGLYCSPSDWLAGKYKDTLGVNHSGTPYIDYIMPQLYWVNFNNQLPNWNGTSFVNGRDMIIGHAAYRFTESGWPADECSKQILQARATGTCKGSVYFSSKSVTGNFASCNDTMKRNYYSNPSINSKMTWRTGSAAAINPPTNLRFVLNASTNKYELTWDKPAATPSGDTAFIYIVYRSETPTVNTSLGSNIFGTTGETYLRNGFGKFTTTKGNYYTVAAVGRYSNESVNNPVIMYDTTGKMPGAPLLASPANGTNNLTSSATLKWYKAPKAETYQLEISFDSTFASQAVCYRYEMPDSIFTFNGISTTKYYYWRVKAANLAGHSKYSQVFWFKSGFPEPPLLIEPVHQSVTVPINAKFKWAKVSNATSYRLQVTTDLTFTSTSAMLYDKTLTDTIFAQAYMQGWMTYYWRVKAINSFGESAWSTVFGFTTDPTIDVKDDNTVPNEFFLKQNYPNPFNPSTTIEYSIADVSQFVTLKIFDDLGREVAVLVNEVQPAGNYSVKFDASSLNSGVYFYTLRAGEFTATRKFVLMK